MSTESPIGIHHSVGVDASSVDSCGWLSAAPSVVVVLQLQSVLAHSLVGAAASSVDGSFTSTLASVSDILSDWRNRVNSYQIWDQLLTSLPIPEWSRVEIRSAIYAAFRGIVSTESVEWDVPAMSQPCASSLWNNSLAQHRQWGSYALHLHSIPDSCMTSMAWTGISGISGIETAVWLKSIKHRLQWEYQNSSQFAVNSLAFHKQFIAFIAYKYLRHFWYQSIGCLRQQSMSSKEYHWLRSTIDTTDCLQSMSKRLIYESMSYDSNSCVICVTHSPQNIRIDK